MWNQPWAVGDYCVSLKMLKSPLKQIYSFKLTMLWLSLSSSLSLPKYFNQYQDHDWSLGVESIQDGALHYTTIHCTTQHYTTLQHTTLHCTTTHYTTLHYNTLHYTTLYYNTTRYTTLPHIKDTTLYSVSNWMSLANSRRYK